MTAREAERTTWSQAGSGCRHPGTIGEFAVYFILNCHWQKKSPWMFVFLSKAGKTSPQATPTGTFPYPESFCTRDKCGPSSCFTNWTDKGSVKPGPRKQSKRRKDKSALIGLHRPRAVLAVNRVRRAESGLRSAGGQMKAMSPRSGETAASPFLRFQQKWDFPERVRSSQPRTRNR